MIEGLNADNIGECAKLAYRLWPDANFEKLMNGFIDIMDSDKGDCFLYYEDETAKEYLGFAQVSMRFDYVEGSDSSPVAYLEGIYVKDENRRKGIAMALVKRAEEWGREKGCSEMASDCSLDNYLSIDFHNGIGFEEANRLVCFIKRI